MHVWLRSSPRAIVLVNNNNKGHPASASALVISTAAASHEASSSTSPARATVHLHTLAEVDLDSCVRLTEGYQEAAGCLGLINVGNDLFVAVVTRASPVGAIRPEEKVMSISGVAFYCVNRPTWDGLDAPPDLQHPGIGTSTSGSTLDPYDAILPSQTPAAAGNATPGAAEHPCTSLKRLLSAGSFYYAAEGAFDLSTRLDRRVGRNAATHDISRYDGRFVWNTFMIEPLMDFRSRLDADERARLDGHGFFLLAIQGYVAVFDMSKPVLVNTPAETTTAGLLADEKHPTTSLAIVSRLSWKRAGTRFYTRGVDDDGNVANFVESETIFCHEGVTTSYVQLRGSIPLFWEQQGLQAFSPRIQITRSRQASQPAYDRHFADLLSHYSRVHALNLLGARDAEQVLSSAYAEHMRHSSAVDSAAPPEQDPEDVAAAAASFGDDTERLSITNFDFHTVSRNAGGLDGLRGELKLLGPVRLKREAFSCTIVDSAGDVRRRQRGVFRTNCLDCLDRTNVVQALLSETLLEDFFDRASRMRDTFQPFTGPAHPIWSHHRVLWAENGDALSRIYAGTGALNTTYTRTGNAKKTLGSFLSDAAKSAGRMYINNFQDRGKQNVIDALLGNMANQRSVEVYDPLHDGVAAELNSRLDEFATKEEITVFTGTWNLNARPPGNESLLPWLCPSGEEVEPDIYALGFQEIVPLSPQQILLTDPAKLRVWEGVIMDALERRASSSKEKKGEYVIVRSEQLVGTALVLLVKSTHLNKIRSVEATSRKTGLKGMSGNKGGVAIRLNFNDSTLCFVTAHLAAGHSNVDERNDDYWTISRGLTFQRGRTLQGHDHVFWLGDFNYRIDMPNERARYLARQGDIGTLHEHDQLRRSRGIVFTGFEEGAIRFLPTYKYDVGTENYDSSEKQRVPAWTDRVLYSVNNVGSAGGGEGHQLRQMVYDRAELKTSDHRPVYAMFRAEVRVFDKEKRNRMRKEILMRASKGGAAGRGTNGQHRGDDDDDDDDDDDELDLPDPSSPTTSSSGRANWFDSRAASGTSEVDDGEGEDEESGDDVDGNPFLAGGVGLDARRRIEEAMATSSPSSPPSSTSTSGRAPPPPRPPKPASVTMNSRKSQDDFYLSTGTSPAPMTSALPAGVQVSDTEGARSKPSVPPRRPAMLARSTSYGGADVVGREERSLLDD